MPRVKPEEEEEVGSCSEIAFVDACEAVLAVALVVIFFLELLLLMVWLLLVEVVAPMGLLALEHSTVVVVKDITISTAVIRIASFHPLRLPTIL